MAERDPAVVISRIMAIVPEHETAIMVRLRSLLESAQYAPPEAMGRVWTKLANLLTETLPVNPSEGWMARVGRIVRAEE
jgi:hypothetical protein